MVTKNRDKRPKRLYVFTYPGQPTATVNVVVDTLKKAQAGRANAQRSILYQYKRTAGIKLEMLLKWKFLKLESHAASEAQKAKSQ